MPDTGRCPSAATHVARCPAAPTHWGRCAEPCCPPLWTPGQSVRVTVSGIGCACCVDEDLSGVGPYFSRTFITTVEIGGPIIPCALGHVIVEDGPTFIEYGLNSECSGSPGYSYKMVKFEFNLQMVTNSPLPGYTLEVFVSGECARLGVPPNPPGGFPIFAFTYRRNCDAGSGILLPNETFSNQQSCEFVVEDWIFDGHCLGGVVTIETL